MIRWNLTAVRTARKVAELCIFANIIPGTKTAAATAKT